MSYPTFPMIARGSSVDSSEGQLEPQVFREVEATSDLPPYNEAVGDLDGRTVRIHLSKYVSKKIYASPCLHSDVQQHIFHEQRALRFLEHANANVILRSSGARPWDFKVTKAELHGLGEKFMEFINAAQADGDQQLPVATLPESADTLYQIFYLNRYHRYDFQEFYDFDPWLATLEIDRLDRVSAFFRLHGCSQRLIDLLAEPYHQIEEYEPWHVFVSTCNLAGIGSRNDLVWVSHAAAALKHLGCIAQPAVNGVVTFHRHDACVTGRPVGIVLDWKTIQNEHLDQLSGTNIKCLARAIDEIKDDEAFSDKTQDVCWAAVANMWKLYILRSNPSREM